MGLVYWAPMTDGTVKNQGIITTQATSSENSHYTSSNSGKLGKCIKTNSSDYIETSIIGDWVGEKSNTLAGWFYFPYDEIKAVVDASSNPSAGTPIPTGTLLGYCSYAGIALSWYTNKPMTTFWAMIAIRTGSSLYTAGLNLVDNNLMDKWVHLAGIWDNDNLKIKFFVNGSEVRQVTIASQQPVKQHLQINRNIIYGGNGPACRIPFYCNDLRVYKDEILSDRDIKHLAEGLVLHYPLSNRGFGGDNIIKNSWPEERTYTYPSSSYSDKFSPITTIVPSASKYTLSFYAKSTVNGDKIRTHYYSPNTTTTCVSSQGITRTASDGNMDFTLSTSWKRYWVTYTQNETTAVKHVICPRLLSGQGTGTVSIRGIKFEEGEKATAWIPNSADTLYSSLQLGSTAELDCSGYQYNGIKNNVVNDTASPVNQGCYVFNGTDSWVRCDTNEWMVQGATEFTVNWWAYAEDWTTVTNGGRMVSCTESGGFNTEGGATGYLRFPHYVFTNEAKTSRAYQYNNNGIKLADLTPGWHMFTLIYNLAGEKIYIDGTLHSSANSTSYGISFNTNARLYLGCEANSASPYTPFFNGKMSDFRFYYTALDADAIKELYMMGGGV